MDKQIFIFLIDKYLSGRAHPEEMEALANYYQSFQDADEWNEEELGDVDEMEARLLKRLHAAIKKEDVTEEITAAETAEDLPVVTVSRGKRFAVAASILAVIALGGFALKYAINNLFHPVKMLSVSTTRGMRRFIKLSDSTSVWLEGGSTFSYPETFSEGDRNVTLQGEAFFEVAEDKTRPFVIQTSLLTTKVLGTSFNIEAYGTKKAEIVVVTGKVMVQESGAGVRAENAQQVVVKPNQKVSYDSTLKMLEMKEAPDAADYIQRRNGKFIYRGVKVVEIIKDLQRAYNTPIAINKNLLDCTIYGDFMTKDPVEKALNLIALSLNGKVEGNSEEGGYYITGEGCH